MNKKTIATRIQGKLLKYTVYYLYNYEIQHNYGRKILNKIYYIVYVLTFPYTDDSIE